MDEAKLLLGIQEEDGFVLRSFPISEVRFTQDGIITNSERIEWQQIVDVALINVPNPQDAQAIMDMVTALIVRAGGQQILSQMGLTPMEIDEILRPLQKSEGGIWGSFQSPNENTD